MENAEFYRQISEDLEEEIQAIRGEYANLVIENETLADRVAELTTENEQYVDAVADLGATVDRLRLHIQQGIEL